MILPKETVVRIMRGPARGRRWIAGSAARGFWLGFWELEHQRLFASHLRAGDVVYDVGAHVGLYTIVSSICVGEQGHVYAFEPLPRNVEFLKRHIEINRLTNCTVIEAAVSDSVGTGFFDPTVHDTAGHLSDEGGTSVRTLSIDAYLCGGQSSRPPNALKIDAEGAEAAILTGARETLAAYSPLIFLSTHSDETADQCTALLRRAGYRLKNFSGNTIWAQKNKRP